jgi:hypothetical protein
VVADGGYHVIGKTGGVHGDDAVNAIGYIGDGGIARGVNVCVGLSAHRGTLVFDNGEILPFKEKGSSRIGGDEQKAHVVVGVSGTDAGGEIIFTGCYSAVDNSGPLARHGETDSLGLRVEGSDISICESGVSGIDQTNFETASAQFIATVAHSKSSGHNTTGDSSASVTEVGSSIGGIGEGVNGVGTAEREIIFRECRGRNSHGDSVVSEGVYGATSNITDARGAGEGGAASENFVLESGKSGKSGHSARRTAERIGNRPCVGVGVG